MIRLGWFRSIHRHLLCLTGGYGDDRLDLLVVPDTPPAVAARAMTLAAGRGNRFTATETLRATRILPDVVAGATSAVPCARPVDPETDPIEAWESERTPPPEVIVACVSGIAPLVNRLIVIERDRDRDTMPSLT